jgi:hypothetical protein
MRWLWFSKTDNERAWSGLDLQFSAEEQAMFAASTHSMIGDEQTTKFWENRCLNGRSILKIAPQLHACISR